MKAPLRVPGFAIVTALLVASSATFTLPRSPLLAYTANATVFGPEIFRREQGKPQTYTRRISVNNGAARYSLEVVNGNPDDNDDFNDKKKGRIASALIMLNDIQVAGPAEIKKETRQFRTPVSLNQGENTLKVTLNGDPVSLLSVALVRIDSPPAIDLTPPSIIAVDPINGATGVDVTSARVRVTFDEPILLDTLTPSAFSLTARGQRVAGQLAPSNDRTGLVFTPASPLEYSTTFTLTVTREITDLAGNQLANVFSSIFTTQDAPPPPPPDLTPPRVVSLAPQSGSSNNQISVPVVIRFSEAVDTDTLRDNLLVFADTAQGTVVVQDGGTFLAVPSAERVTGMFTSAPDKLSAMFTPTTTLPDRSTTACNLPADATITVVALTRVKDLEGNNLDQDSATTGRQFFAASFSTSQFNLTGATTVARFNPQASPLDSALLPGDAVIITGGYDQFDHVNSTADIYDRVTGSFHSVPMMEARAEHTTTVLDGGKVLIVGGIGENGQVLSSAELYDPVSGSFTSVGAMNTPRFGHTATLLSDGTVLIAGGYNAAALDSSEVFIPAGHTLPFTNMFLSVPTRMSTARAFHTATSLPGGYVLIAGGASNGRVLNTAEVFVPTPFVPTLGQFVSGSSPLTPWKMSSARHHHTATALGNGTVLITGGRNDLGVALRTADIFTPSTPITLSTFSSTGLMTAARASHSATALSDGSVLIAGGIVAGTTTASTAETFYNGQFTRTSSTLSNARSSHAAVLLSDGTVLLSNGLNGNSKLSSAETFSKRR